MQNPPKTNHGARIVFVQVMLVACILVLGARSVQLQIFDAGELKQKAQSDYYKDLTIKGERGEIFDRGMNKLATSMDAISISACPAGIPDPEDTARRLALVLDENKNTLKKKLSGKKMFAWVARSISPAQAKKIKEMNITGIYFEKDFKRFYPYRNTAAQIIGFTNAEDVGLEGLEFKYNPLLEGGHARLTITRDGNGRIFDLDKTKRSELKGESILLTLDKKIQYVCEKTLEETVTQNRAKSGIALVMDPKTGELLAIAHYPEFNPNNFTDYDPQLFRNRAITDAFEPGSAIKIFTAAAALERGFGPKQIFFCENGAYRIGEYTIHDTHEHGWLSINQIVKFSSNIGAAKIAETIGDKTLHNCLTRFGFGERTDVGCPGETAGNLTPYHSWSRIDAGAISFGQGMSASALQVLTAVSAVANDGRLMKPMLIKKVISNTGEVIRTNRPEIIRQAISIKTAEKLKRMMNLVVAEDGTGAKAAMDGYEVCGKTGTAQKALKNKRGYEKNKYISVFTGFAPRKNPRLAVLVVIDEPKKQYYGGDVAAPAFKTIMTESFNYLNVPPAQDASMFALAHSGEKN